MGVRVKSERIGDAEIVIEVDSGGTFSAEIPDGDGAVTGKTLEDVIAKARAAVTKAKRAKPVEITIYNVAPKERKGWEGHAPPFDDGIGLVHCTLRGWSDRRRALLITYEGKKYIVDDYNIREQVARRFKPEEEREYARLSQAAADAAAALKTFLEERKIDAREATSAESAA